jgi:hypothetical protein
MISFSFSTQNSEVDCNGVERWDVKTLTDIDSKKVNFKADTVTIDYLTKIQPDRKIGNKLPRFGIEFKTYVIICGIREYRREEDGDYHLVLYDLKDTTKTMIGEIPLTFCSTVAKSKYAKKFEQSSDYFEQKIMDKKNKTKKEVYKIYGPAFYDKKHGQLGLAPNGIEIHPILSIKKVS